MPRILVLYHSMYGHIDTLARTVADGSRQPDERELTIARFQGEHVARIAAKLAG